VAPPAKSLRVRIFALNTITQSFTNFKCFFIFFQNIFFIPEKVPAIKAKMAVKSHKKY